MNSLTLAYLGDAVYEVSIRKYLIEQGIIKVKDLQTESVKYVSAKKQAEYLKEMLELNFFDDQELSIIMTARNHKNNHKPKSCDIITYKYATGLEALIGYLYVNNNTIRINEIIEFITRR